MIYVNLYEIERDFLNGSFITLILFHFLTKLFLVSYILFFEIRTVIRTIRRLIKSKMLNLRTLYFIIISQNF